MRALGKAILAVVLALALFSPPAQAAPPTVLEQGVIHLRTDSATAWAELDLHNKAANYHFEYGTADCASNPCAKTPEPEGVLKKSEGSIFVEASLEGLVPATAYHFRVVVTGEATTKGPDSTFVTYAPPQVFEPCPNEAFRSGELSPLDHPSAKLPDCRAYEQASPVDKNGGDAIGVRSLVHASSNGDTISFATATGFPGGEGSQELPFYLSSRGAGDWSTQGALPPQSIAKDARVIGWTPDFSQTFSVARILTGGQFDSALLSRSSADGSITPIVPYGSGVGGVANFAYAGASADGSKVVFESRLALSGVPGAIAGKPNVYLWDRESGDLHLVDVSNSLQSGPDGGIAGPYDWIGGHAAATMGGGASGEGPGFGTNTPYYTQDQHAIAQDGSVYFTEAGTGQLYLRKNPTQPQSAVVTNSDGEEECTEAPKACTVHISATEKDNGTGPGHIDAAGPAPAAFVAATPDGSKAFFTSSEKLTNDANTGPEPSAPAIARAKIGATKGEEAKLSFLPTDASGVTVEGEFLYWVDTEAGTIGRAKLSSGDPSEIDPEYLSGAGVPEDVAVQGEFLYWTDNAGEEVPEDGKGGLGFVGRAKLGAVKAEEVEPHFIEGASDPRGIDVDSEHIYWVNAGLETEASGVFGCVARAALNGNPASVESKFLMFAKRDVAVSASKIYFSAISSVNGFIRWANLDGTEVGHLSSNGTPIELVGSQTPADLALDGSHIYWTNKGESQIGRSKLDGSEPEPEYIVGAGHPQGIALSSEHVYWSANQGEVPPNLGNDLYRYDATEPAGERLTDLTVDNADINGADVLGVLGVSDDGAYVYFVANGVLAAGATPGDCKGNATIFINFTGHCSLYLAHDGEPTRFIARLDAPEDATDWLPHGGLADQAIENTGRVSADGRTVLFSSHEKLTGYDNKGVSELYRYRVGDPGPACVSCNPTGLPPSGSPSFGSIYFPGQLVPTDAAFTYSRNLSADGNRVFFQTPDPLVEADTNGDPAHVGEEGCPNERWTFLIIPVCQDVYEWEAKGTGSCETDEQGGGCPYLLSSGKGREGSFMADASTGGDDAFIITTSPDLVRQDQDQLYDFYDVRVRGGLASQNSPPGNPCEGESCPQPPPPAPEIRSPQTPRFQGPGNPPSSRCAKGRVARHGRCAKKVRHHKQRHRRQRKRQSAASTRGRSAR